MGDVIWGDPPKPERNDKWQRIAAELRTRPGAWAQVDAELASPGGAAVQIKRGLLAAFRPAGAFEARVVTRQLWVRYVGDLPHEDLIEVPPTDDRDDSYRLDQGKGN